MTSETNQPTEANAQPELKQVLGALLFAARKPIATGELHGILVQVNQNGENAAHSFGKIQESDIRTALEQLKTELVELKLGLVLVEVAGGFRFQTDPAGGPWVRQLLNLDKPARLSKPALETLAIIAYRQPATRAEIEALRGVNVDAMMRHLLELQLIRIVGRSDLPGRPLMYGTTQLFLEHFGLSSVKNLPGVEQLSRRDAERVKKETDDGRQTTDGRLQTPDASPEKTEDGGRTPDAGPEKTEDGRQRTDAGRQTPDASTEKTDDGLPTVAPSEVEGAKAELQKTEEANIDLSAIALATAEHPTLLRPSASEGKPSNAQRRMEEKKEEEETDEDEDDEDEDDEGRE